MCVCENDVNMSQSRERSSSPSIKKPSVSDVNVSENHSEEEDNLQITLAPYIQIYLAYTSSKSRCFGRFLPVPFERAAKGSWYDPRFDSEILEGQYKNSAFPHFRLKFRYALFYLLLVAIVWLVYFAAGGVRGVAVRWGAVCPALAAFVVPIVCLLLATDTRFYRMHLHSVSLAAAVALCTLSLALAVCSPLGDVSWLGQFSICVQVLLLLYTVIPMPLYACVLTATAYSVVFECVAFSHDPMLSRPDRGSLVAARILAQICVHLVGLHVLIMNNVRMRGTFMKVGQSLLVRRQLEMERQLKEKMIISVMPPKVARWLMNDDAILLSNPSPRNSEAGDLKSLFRPFNMNRIENVSILFADIVGFTRMSSTKSAEELVAILNDLFERFDDLCSLYRCEKISTLGDCYYCVSGCPEPQPDHAKCCVEMGLGMIQAIKEFDTERSDGVNMRVGIHTGTVLCGIVGTRRFKFDVWSNDVTLANKMESTGRPGAVHISEATYEFIKDLYDVENGDQYNGQKTYFIIGRKMNRYQLDMPVLQDMDVCGGGDLATSSFLLASRPRLLSYQSPQASRENADSHLLRPPHCKPKANSLPSILDSEEGRPQAVPSSSSEIKGGKMKKTKSPTSFRSVGKYSSRLKYWRRSRQQKKAATVAMPNTEPEIIVTDIGSKTDTSCEVHCSNGYQQIPMIIETSQVSGGGDATGTSDAPSKAQVLSTDESTSKPNDIIDIKSYISQSRSDIGQYDISPTELSHFMRTSSYKSHCGNQTDGLERSGSQKSYPSRSPNLGPVERARSATVASPVSPYALSPAGEGAMSGIAAEDRSSLSVSEVNSRKDSGIKSNSRRSSVQHQIFAMSMSQTLAAPSDLYGHRVSGYYTSSQSTLQSYLPSALSNRFGASFHKLRKQSDLQLIKCIQENSQSQCSYFTKPPLSPVTLFFRSYSMESDYRLNVHTLTDRPGVYVPTLATSRYNTYFDVLISAIVLVLVCVSLWLIYTPSPLWYVSFVLLLTIQLFAVVACLRQIINYRKAIFDFFSKWYRWHAIGAVLVSLPIVAVITNLSCENLAHSPGLFNNFYTHLALVGLVHFSNFTQLNCWMKNLLAASFTALFITVVIGTGSYCHLTEAQSLTISNNTLLTATAITITNRANSTDDDPTPYDLSFRSAEIFVDLFLVLVLVWLLNREFEISHRLSFHANVIANRDKAHVQNMKNQADWLLHNIIPKYVADQLKKSAKYSANHKDVGIIFASIVNFNEMYDESYMGGKEFLRVLNELIGDFDELLTKPEFKSVEKIKTIGSTFMAASGLNPHIRGEQKHPLQHLYELMDFAIAMQHVIDDFNRDLLEFNLILRVGYNCGDVTAGVIGTTKLYYDIWGDAVNIASRMDSTGVNGRIQVPGACYELLKDKYEFEHRGSVYVKGKDNMNVYLLKKKIDDDKNLSGGQEDCQM